MTNNELVTKCRECSALVELGDEWDHRRFHESLDDRILDLWDALRGEDRFD